MDEISAIAGIFGFIFFMAALVYMGLRPLLAYFKKMPGEDDDN